MGKNKKTGKIILRTENVETCRDILTFKFCGHKLRNTGGFLCWKSSPFLRLLRQREDGTWLKVHQTKQIRSNLNPQFPTFNMTMQKLCNGDPTKLIKLQCWAFGRNSTHISMGEFTFTIQDIQNGHRSWRLKKKKKNGTIKDK